MDKCIICGRALTGKQEKYCSAKCRKKAYRLRKKKPRRKSLVLSLEVYKPKCIECLYYKDCRGLKQDCEYKNG